MIGHLVRKEILDQVLGLRFLILSILASLIIWLSLYDGYAYYRARLEDYRMAQAATEQRIRQIRAADTQRSVYPWYELSNMGFYEHKPPQALSIFIRGLDPAVGRSVTNVGSSGRRLRKSPMEAEPILGVFPPLDLGVVVQVVMSLFMLLFTYDAISGEKEGGTLRLMASFSVPRHQLLVGKLVGILLPVLSVFFAPLLLGIGVILALPEAQGAGMAWGRLGTILAAFGLYLAVFAVAGLLGSCLTHRSATSFVLLLSFWAASVVTLPRLSLIAADAFHPAPSVHEHQAKRSAIYLQYTLKWRELRSRWQQERSQPGKEWWRTPEGREAERLNYSKTQVEIDRQRDPEVALLDEAFRNRYNARRTLAVTLARCSPAFAFKNAVVRLAGAGIDRQQRFERAFVEDYGRRFDDWFRKTSDLDILRQVHPAKYGRARWDVSDMPRFTYRETWPGEDLQDALFDVGFLALWGLAFFAGAYVTMLRYDMR